ncbi:DUF6106 family protein [Ruminococcus sp. HUN007]|uniref:DUF6106 family protein n=1 Tax=Ruminococcus sp. HUN007 TaxID=1514668 RepID=UPI0005D1A217|nr:DUF6106 family protein [Ruminococcus sp. HUN007]
MDSYAEQIVKKADNGSDKMKRGLCYAGGVAAGILIIFLAQMLKVAVVGIFLGVGAFYGGLYLGTNYDVEYEYLVVNNELDIDKILAKKRRKKLITVKTGDFVDFGKYTEDLKSGDETVIWAVGTSSEVLPTFYGDFEHPTYGKCRLLFSPSVKVLRELKHGLKPSLRNNIGELPPEEE